jgi:aspartyl-tRNA(Asn)/glutamyl-tRNA(Gln) amidotransferase subunit A
MADDELTYLTLAEIAELIHKRQVSPVEVVSATIRRIGKLDPLLGSFITVAGEQALESARSLEERDVSAMGPLHGIPVALKDNIATVGIRTTAGSALLSDWVPDFDATVVERLRTAGAVIIGKNTLWEFAFGGPHPMYAEARNPWDPQRSCGGSSSGSGACVAAGLSYAALGTDTAGSVRAPASFCGLVGLKPTYGRVSRFGVLPVSYSLDHVAPFARTVRDAALILHAIAGPDVRDPTTSARAPGDFTSKLEDGIRGSRLGIASTSSSDDLDPQVAGALTAAHEVLQQAGAAIVEVSLPETAGAAGIILDAEAAEAHRRTLRSSPEQYAPVTRTRFEVAEYTPATDYIHAQRVRQRAIEATEAVFAQVDAVLVPAVIWGMPALLDPNMNPTAEADVKRVGLPGGVSVGAQTALFNLTGHPALVVPCGFTREGFPIGMQIAGRFWQEDVLLRIARTYERATEWCRRVPPRSLETQRPIEPRREHHV